MQGKKYRKFLDEIYGDRPTVWADDLTGYERPHTIVNAFTRTRALTYKGELGYEYRFILKKVSLYLRL